MPSFLEPRSVPVNFTGHCSTYQPGCCTMLQPGSPTLPDKPFGMPSLSSNFTDLNLVSSIPREDIPALLPIIKVAFPFINGRMLAEVGLNTSELGYANSVPCFVQTEDSPMEQYILHNVDKRSQREECSSSLPLSGDVMAFSGQQKAKNSTLTAASSSSFTGQAQMVQSKACEAGSTFDDCCGQLPYYACLTPTDTNPQITLSSMTDLSSVHMSAHWRMMDMQAMRVSDERHDVVYLQKGTNFSSNIACALSRGTECSSFVDEPHLSTNFSTTECSANGPFKSADQNISELNRHCHMTGRSCNMVSMTIDRTKAAGGREINAFEDRKRKFELTESLYSIECEHVSKREQVLQYISCADARTTNIIEVVSPLDLNETWVKRAQTGSISSSKECSDECPSCDAADCTSLADSAMQEHAVERCHRTNGKQWQCSEKTFSGTSYCKLHLEYVKKRRTNVNQSSKILCAPNTESNALEMPWDKHDRLHNSIRECSGGRNGELKRAILKFSRCKKEWNEKSTDGPRCRRSDGKLWQCAKQAKEGSIYCDHHSSKTQRPKQTGKHESARKTKQRAKCESKTSSNGEEDVQACYVSILESEKDTQQVCQKSLVSRENGYGGEAVQSEGKESPEFIQSSEQAMDVVSFLAACDTGWSEHSAVEHQGLQRVHVVPVHNLCSVPGAIDTDEERIDQETSKEQCQRKDGKGWQCSLAPKHGFRYCEHHLRYLSKRNEKNAQKKQK